MLGKAAERGRFAPTPSGRMHLGNALCSLLAWLSARAAGGEMVLRIEDLDEERCPAEFAALLEEDLLWLGLDWDAGGAGGGPAYFQSRRAEIYDLYLERLHKQGAVYPCFCSRAELHVASAPHRSDGTYLYSGRCRNLSAREVEERARQRPPAMRLCVEDRAVSFTDWGCGDYAENLAQACGDYILRRSDGVYSYQLAVVVDDALMGVTQVVRGSDLLPSAARQIDLYRRLGFEPPAFGHIPMLYAPDGRRLSKRDGDLDLGALRGRFTPEELVGRLAALCGLIRRPEPVRARELIGEFSWDKLPRGELCLPPDFLEG